MQTRQTQDRETDWVDPSIRNAHNIRTYPFCRIDAVLKYPQPLGFERPSGLVTLAPEKRIWVKINKVYR
jgi:hypothetical protein